MNYNKKIKTVLEYVNKVRTYSFPKTDKHELIALRALYASIISMVKVSIESIQNNEIVTSGIISSSIIEAEIQLLWMCEDIENRGNDYYDFGWIEQIKSLELHPEWKNSVIKKINESNCKRFLKKKHKDTNDILNRDNYVDYWYQIEVNTLKDLSKETFLDICKENKFEDDIWYENYQIMCLFKHFNPFIICHSFSGTSSLEESITEGYIEEILNICEDAILRCTDRYNIQESFLINK